MANYYNDLWTDIIETKKNKNQFGWRKLYDYNGAVCATYDKDFIDNLITDNEVKSFVPDEPIFLVAQTGAGKTTFVFNKCLPNALLKNKKVLYLANRSSLVEQMKQRCLNDDLNRMQYVGIGDVLVKEMKQYFKDEFINKTNNLGGLDVYSYQKFLKCYRKIDLSQYQYVILDEANFFVSDATFNRYTEEILDIIIKYLKDAVRIYMTATPQECIDIIYSKEIEAISNRNKTWNPYALAQAVMRIYVVDEDYRYLNPYFFSNDKFILKKIRHSSPEDSWLIFVRDKKHGETLKKQLEEIDGGVVFFTADSDKGEPEYIDLINNERLPARVLISTRVLDVGVNIRTSNLHMIIYEDNLVEIKQMIGRKRVKDNERLDVYFFLASYDQLEHRFKQVETRLRLEKDLIRNKDKLECSYQYELGHPLYYQNGIKANYLSCIKLTRDFRYYKMLLEALRPYENNTHLYNKAYGELVLNYFPGSVFLENLIVDIQNDTDEAVKASVLELIHSKTGVTLNKEELHEFGDELKALGLDKRSDQRVGREHMGKQAIDRVLLRYGYCVLSLKSTPVTYKIVYKREV